MITLVYSYYNNPGMLERHCQEWANYDADTKTLIRAIVVDDGSDKSPAVEHVTDPGFPVQVYRIKENLIWNVAGARNLGMRQAPDGWCLLTDIDHLLPAADAARLVRMKLNHRAYYLPARRWLDGRPLHPHSNTYVLQRALYWRVGGCDEDYTGWWGGGEPAFRKMIKTLAPAIPLSRVTLAHVGLETIADAQTTDWGRKESPYYWSKNAALLKKWKGRPYRPVNPLRFTWEQVA